MGRLDSTTRTAAPPEPRAPIRDEEFFFRLVVFRAGDTVFRVPTYYLMDGENMFSSMFSLPNDPDGEGASEENPIVLPEEVSTEDFRSLLQMSIPIHAASTPRQLALNSCMSALKLANMYCVKDVRDRAITAAEGTQKFKGMPLIDRVLLAKDHRVSRWLLSDYTALAARDEGLTDNECDKLDFVTCRRLFQIRDRSWRWANPQPHKWAGMVSTPSSGLRSDYAFTPDVHATFAEELKLDADYVAPSATNVAQSNTRS